jgi:hypothetical protein
MSYTNIIFQNPHFSVVKDGSYASVTTSDKICRGEILLIEHSIVSDDIAKVVNIVNQNSGMYDTLCPRETDLVRGVDTATKKVASNMFRTEELFALGKQVSMINHGCSPNAMVTYTHVRGFKIPISFMVVYAIEDISTQEEVKIMYGSNVGHETNEYHDFQCDCGKSADERSNTFNSIKCLRDSREAGSGDIMYQSHLPILQAYIAQDPYPGEHFTPQCTAVEVVSLQLLAMVAGVYKANEQQLVPTARFGEYIQEHHGVGSSAPDSMKYQALMTVISTFENDAKTFLSTVNLS